jgi:acetyl esterase/lipase
MKRRAIAAASALALLVGPGAPAFAVTWQELAARPHAKADAKIAYGPASAQFVELWLPAGAGPHPVVVMLHGGCWIKGVADLHLMDYAAEALRKRGVAVWNVEYRGIDEPGGGYPGTFQDVGAAVDLLRTIAPKYGLRLDEVTAVGHSAGGHLGLWAAARGKLPEASPLRSAGPLRIDAVISLGGLGDIEAVTHRPASCRGEPTIRGLVGAPTAAHPNVYADTSPVELEPFTARQILIHGSQDPIAPSEPFGTGYRDKAARRGAHAELRVIEGAGHFDLIAPGTPAWTEIETLIVGQTRLGRFGGQEPARTSGKPGPVR